MLMYLYEDLALSKTDNPLLKHCSEARDVPYFDHLKSTLESKTSYQPFKYT